MISLRSTQAHRYVEETYLAHFLLVLCFILALEKTLELFFYEGDTFRAPPVYFVLLNFFCPTFGNGSVPRFYLSTD